LNKPKRSENKYWTGTRNFDEIHYADDLEEYISELEEKLAIQVKSKVKQLPITEDLIKEATEILKLRAMTLEVPEFMKKQKILVEWARKTATLISNQSV